MDQIAVQIMFVRHSTHEKKHVSRGKRMHIMAYDSLSQRWIKNIQCSITDIEYILFDELALKQGNFLKKLNDGQSMRRA